MCNGSLLVQEADLKQALEMYAKADTPHASFSEVSFAHNEILCTPYSIVIGICIYVGSHIQAVAG